ncbi:MAG: SMP-30/gluconolactonase/LRE family protein [Burkholderiales bacterium]
MRPVQAPCVVDCQNVLGEGPVWCPREHVLWWIDISSPALWRFAPRPGTVDHWALPKPPGSFALRNDGGFLIAFRSGLATLDEPGGEVRWLDVPELQLGDERFNDGKADRAGRFWTGTLDRRLGGAIGQLYRVEPGFRVAAMDRGFTIANGIGWSPDDRTMYFTDTPARRIYRYDFDRAAGRIANRQVFVEVDAGHGGPDGLTVDAAGYVWSAQFDRWCIHRYAPDGTLDRSVRLPVQRPTSCTFGGTDLATLYVTTARMDLEDAALAAQPHAGGVLALDVGVRGLPEPRFGG